MEDGQLDLFPVAHVEAEVLVVRWLVGFLFGESLSNFAVVHLHHNIGVQGWGCLVEDDRVPERKGGRFEVQRLADPELQITVELHFYQANLA